MHFPKKCYCVLFSFLTILFHTSLAYSLPINSDLGLTPHKEEFIFRTQARTTKKTDDPTGQGREVDVLAIPFVGVYGITAKASVLAKIAYLDKELSSNNGPTRSQNGLGDLTLLGKYRIHTHNFRGGTSRLSVLAGLELPTGDHDATDAVGKLPPPLQLGSGSVDAIVGSAYTYQTLNHELDTDLRYKFNQEADDFEHGDVFQYNLSYQRRVLPSLLPDEGIYNQWNVVLEMNGVYQQKAESFSNTVQDSGGHTIFISPGIQFVSQRGVLEASFQYPLLQDLNGNQLETDYKLALSVRFQF